MADFTSQTILEAALLTSRKPLTIREMRRLFNDGPSAKTIRQELEALQRFWKDRGMRLEELADGGWRFRPGSRVSRRSARRATPAPRWKRLPSLPTGSR